MHKKRNAIMAVLAVVLVAALTIGGTLAYMTDSQSLTNVFTVGDLDVKFDEPNYPTVCDTDDRVPGDSFPKDPTVKLTKGSAYMRVKVEFLDTASNQPVSADRLAKILKTLYYDPLFSATADGAGYKGSANLKVYAGGAHTPSNVYHYTETDLAGKVTAGLIQNWFNQNDFVVDAARSSGSLFYLNYTNAASNDIYNVATGPVQVFTSVVFPSNWNQNDPKVLGAYSIKLTVEVIQSQGFANSAQAFTALDAETILVNYGDT